MSQVAECDLQQKTVEQELTESGREELTDMSLIVAAHNGKTIVVAADTYMYEGTGKIYRTGNEVKLRTVNEGRWVVAYSGKTTPKLVWDYIDAARVTFDQDIRIGIFAVRAKFGEIFKEFRMEPDSQMLLVGFSGDVPYIYKWTIGQSSLTGGDTPPWAAIGCGVDVALHFIWNNQPLEELSADELKRITYFSVAEIARSDNRVGKPIDLAVCEQGKARILRREDFLDLDAKAEAAHQSIYLTIRK